MQFVILVIVLTLVMALMLYGALTRQPVLNAKKWADLPWQSSTCSVVSSGSEYTGTCWEPPGYAICPGSCGGQITGEPGNELYYRVIDGQFDIQADGQGRRLRRCHDSFLPWVLVTVPGQAQPICAYEYGVTDSFVWTSTPAYEWQRLPAGTNIPCRTLDASYDPQQCIVALSPLTKLVDRLEKGSYDSWISFWVLFPCVLCCCLGVCSLCVHITVSELPKDAMKGEKQAFAGGQAAQHLHLVDARSQQLELPPGHWSRWSAQDIKVASERLFDYYDTNRSGRLDLGEMLQIMGDIGIKNKRIVMRTMVQLDHDESGLIERDEFEDFCRQIFWNGQRELVKREFERQQDISGAQFVTVQGLAHNQLLIWLEIVLLTAFVVFVFWIVNVYGSFRCDVRLRRYLWGICVSGILQIVFLIGLVAMSWMSAPKFVYPIMQVFLVAFEVISLVWSAIGVGLVVSSSTCHLYLYRFSVIVALILGMKSIVFMVSICMAISAACIRVKRGTALNSLGIDDDPDSDSEYEEITVDEEELDHK